MSDVGRVVTAKLPEDLVAEMDRVSERIDRSKSWIVRQALAEWLTEEQRRYDLTLEALKDVDQGRIVDQAEMRHWAEQQKNQKRAKSAA